MTSLSATSPAAKEILTKIIGKDGNLRASKPKDGSAAYVWRMVGFYVSEKHSMQCIPMTADFGVVVPPDWKVDAPEEWLAAQIENTHRNATNVQFCVERKGSVEAYHRSIWPTSITQGRFRYYVEEVLDPIVDEIVNSVPHRSRHGINRWGRALGFK